MAHWIVDLDGEAFAAWREALPGLAMLARRQLAGIPREAPGVIWCRVRAGESPDAILCEVRPGPAQQIVVLADEPDEAMVSAALSAGAAGCCNAYAAPEVLRQVALVVENGGLWVGQPMLQRLIGQTARIFGQRPEAARNDGWEALLSEREIQVARLVACGESNKEIARALTITERTVKAHLTAIFEKLGLRDRLHLSLRVNGVSI